MRITQILKCVSKLPKNYANFPERYIKKQTEFIEWDPPKMPNYQRRKVRYRLKPYYDIHRPWTAEFQAQNAPNVPQPRIFVQPIREWYMFKGDRVEILNGKDKGKQGIVNYIVKERNWVTVEGLNCEYKLQNKSYECPGIMIRDEQPLLVPRDVALVDPSDQKPTEIEWRYDEEGNQVRVSARTGRIIPIPSLAYETADYKKPQLYVEQDKDTKADDVKQVTFEPKVKTFEMDIMDQMNIKEDRVPYPMYWY